jgi:hypothetical protein
MTPDAPFSVREARARYFAESGFGADGGYAKRWVTVRLGPLPLAFPNTAARVRAVRYHDLHHVVTGYRTDVVGEAEIGAWEVGGGCAGFGAAWILNLYAMVLGFGAGAPGAVWRAFVRGRRTRNLYRTPWSETLLDAPVAELRAQLGLDAVPASPGPATGAERAAFAAWSAAALALATLTLAALATLVALFVGLVR